MMPAPGQSDLILPSGLSPTAVQGQVRIRRRGPFSLAQKNYPLGSRCLAGPVHVGRTCGV